MDMDVDKHTMIVKKMEKKAMKKKKTNAITIQVENNSEESRKRENGSLCINMDVDKDVARGAINCTIAMSDLREDDNHYDKAMKKKKKDKRKSQVGSESSNANCAEEDSNYQNEKDKKKKKKDKRSPEVGSNKDHDEADDNYQNKNHKKKRKRRLEQMGGDQSNVEIYDVEKENNFLQVNDGEFSENGSEQKERKKKKRRSKDEDRKPEDDSVSVPTVIIKDKDGEGFNIVEEHENSQKLNEGKSEKKNSKKKLVRNGDGGENCNDVEADMKMQNSDANVSEKVKKKHKREKNKERDLKDGEDTNHSTRKRSEGNEIEGDKVGNEKETNAVESNSKDPKLKKKKVTFSDHNKVFPLEGKIIQGKRFSPEEDERVKKAVVDYIKAHDLGDEGLTMVLNCKSHPKVSNCWKEITKALPYRPYKSVYDRAHILFERDETRTWDAEDYEILRKYHAQHGPKWKQMADAMGKHSKHVRNAWQYIKLTNRKKGHWSQEEYQNLFDLVNIDLRLKVKEEKKSKHGMLRDNISWGAISDRLTTRNITTCSIKWYNQLTSPMVKEGVWADSDDYRLIGALHTLDACCIEDVDWDSLLEHRSGEICRKRWNQMSNHIGENGKKSFAEQVEILSKRYCPELMELREAWDSKPLVP